MDIRDIIGGNVNRPDTPDFWRLSEVLTGLTAKIDEQPNQEHKEAAWDEQLRNVGDVDSIQYMAFQRCLRAYGIPGGRPAEGIPASGLSLLEHARLLHFWVDAFLAGANFEKSGGHRDTYTDGGTDDAEDPADG